MKEMIKGLYNELGGRRAVLRLISLVVLVTFLFFLDSACSYSDFSQVNFNGWLGAILGGFAYACTFVGVLLLLPPKVSRALCLLIVPWTFVYSVFSFVAMQNFGMVFRGEAVQILLGSSWQEIKDFFAIYAKPKWIIGFIFVFGISVGLIVGTLKCGYFKISRASLLLALVMMIPWCVWTARFPPAKSPDIVRRIKSSTILRYSAISFWEETYKSWSQFKDLTAASNAPNLPLRLKSANIVDEPILGVMVLGESSTKNRWSLYGYDKTTNPLLSIRKKDLDVWTDLVTPASGTTQSLRYILSAATKEQDTHAKYLLPSICKRAGYRNVFLSNQGHWGQYDGVDTVIFRDADKKIWICDEKKPTIDNKNYDGMLLSYLNAEIEKLNCRAAIFLHCAGSHQDVRDKCPPSMAKFGLDENGVLKEDATKSEHYDNSIAYTDYVLDEMIKMLEKRGGVSFLVYLSDHGESPSSEYWRYAPDKDLWEVPMFIWMSEEYKAKYPEIVDQVKKSVDKPLVSDQLLFGFTKLFLVEGLPDYKEEEDFLSDKFIPREKRYNEKVQGVK